MESTRSTTRIIVGAKDNPQGPLKEGHINQIINKAPSRLIGQNLEGEIQHSEEELISVIILVSTERKLVITVMIVLNSSPQNVKRDVSGVTSDILIEKPWPLKKMKLIFHHLNL